VSRPDASLNSAGSLGQPTHPPTHPPITPLPLDTVRSSSTGKISDDACVPALLRKAADLDVVKRSSTRKGRVLVVFADAIEPVKGGKLGTIHNLDGDPYMDVEFPEGVMRFLGSLVFPANKYVSLNVGKKEATCEDIFDSMLLFSEVEWLPDGDASRKRKVRGSADDLLPQSLVTRRLHEAAEDGQKDTKRKVSNSKDSASQENTSSAGKKEGDRPTRRRSQPARNVVALIDSDSSEDD